MKKPSESKDKWDYYKILATTPPDQVLHPLNPKCDFKVGA